MPYQSTVAAQMAAGVPGELAFEGPLRSKPYILNTGTEANNIIGRVLTVVSEGVAAVGGTGVFAGILANPKVYANPTVAPGLYLPNGTVIEAVTMGEIWVTVPGACAIGDAVKYTTATGVIGTGAPGGGEAAVPNAVVSYFTPTGAGLAVIKLTN